MSREARPGQELPVPLRRDVRLLGDLLGEVIRESGGQDLLDDVERLRRAVIAAREKPPGDEADLAGDQIAALVAGWPLARAELVAKAFTDLLPPDQPGRGTAPGPGAARPGGLRAGGRGGGWGAAARVAGRRGGRVRRRSRPVRRSCWPGCGSQPVLTAHPTEARRRAVAAALRRIAVLVEALDGARAAGGPGRGPAAVAGGDRPAVAHHAAAGQADRAGRRGAHGHGRVRRHAVQPGPGLLPGARCGLPRRARGRRRAGPGGRRVPAVRQLGGRGPGRQPHRDRPGDQGRGGDPRRPRAARAGERHHQGRPRPHRARRGRAAQRGPRARAGGRRDRAPRTPRADRRAVPRGAVSHLPAFPGRTAFVPPGCARPTWPTPAATRSSPTCAWSRPRWPARAPGGRRSGSCRT